MKKRIIIGIDIILLLVCCKLVFSHFYNEMVIYRYKNQDYSISVSPLLVGNWFQPYIAHYNNGNIHYRNGDYVDAQDAYNKALASNPPKGKECPVRINLALAMIGALGDDYDAPDNIDSSIETLKAARDVLLEEECATESGNGHDETAEKLKKEIEEMIRSLEEKSGSDTSDKQQDKEEQKEQQKDENDAFEEDVKKAMQERQSDANRERKESLDSYEEFNEGFNFDYDGHIW